MPGQHESVDRPHERHVTNGTPTYTCPMHPEIQQASPGTCPKCGMALEPVASVVVRPDAVGLPDAPSDRPRCAGYLPHLRDGAGAA